MKDQLLTQFMNLLTILVCALLPPSALAALVILILTPMES
jgi:hypothetical protein